MSFVSGHILVLFKYLVYTVICIINTLLMTTTVVDTLMSALTTKVF